jgi:MFS_1 like family
LFPLVVIDMDWRNRIGLNGAYFCAMAGIGFTLPYLPLYLRERGLSDRDIGILSTLAALSALVQFLVGISGFTHQPGASGGSRKERSASVVEPVWPGTGGLLYHRTPG